MVFRSRRGRAGGGNERWVPGSTNRAARRATKGSIPYGAMAEATAVKDGAVRALRERIARCPQCGVSLVLDGEGKFHRHDATQVIALLNGSLLTVPLPCPYSGKPPAGK